MIRNRVCLLFLFAAAATCALALLARQRAGKHAPEARRDAAEGVAKVRGQQPTVSIEGVRIEQFLKQHFANTRARVDTLETALRTKLAELDRDPTNQVLAEQVDALTQELQSAARELARMRQAVRSHREPELGGSCVFWLPNHFETRE